MTDPAQAVIPDFQDARGVTDAMARPPHEILRFLTRVRRLVVRHALATAALLAIAGALVVYCAGCMLTVQDDMARVADVIAEALGEAPFLGTFTFGEQGCFVGGENHHGNLMISVVVFQRDDEAAG